MNKLFLFLALASFALVACSEDKPEPSQTEICSEKPITQKCLVGNWRLDRVEENSECNPIAGSNLELQKNGRFIFRGAYDNNPELEKPGAWELIDGKMRINCDLGDCDPRVNSVDATIETRNSGQLELRITTSGYSAFLQCSSEGSSKTFTEVFVWKGK